MERDTIAAIATVVGNSGVGIVRISGPEAFLIGDRLFRSKKEGKKLSGEAAYTVHYGTVWDDGEMLDEVLVLLMRAPHSYTAEDTVEIDCHGGAYVTQRILEAALRQGARLADPGEFTKRAFLNGRIDLSQAEAVMDLIEAKSEAALRSSVRQVRGAVRQKIQDLRQKILYETAFLESALDDPEHFSLEGYPVRLEQAVDGILAEIDRLLRESENGRILTEGIKTVIVGKPNVGKSSLLNMLAGEERAIVTEIAGTTRDVLEEHVRWNGIVLNVLDTAGIRKTENIVEKIGVTKALEHIADADLILYVADSSVPLSEEDERIMEKIREKKTIALLNKSDLKPAVTEKELKEKLNCPVLSVSAKEGKGMEELERTVRDLFFQGELSVNEEFYITNLRQKAGLEEARESLLLVKESIRNKMPEDFFSVDLMDGYSALGRILGEEVGEDLINEIFSKFCMGK